ncbi:MAG: hypothetical protein E7170_00755 [Firmicutes bacterium]|nr:hypothetical protein [Bacillota bacterium]
MNTITLKEDIKKIKYMAEHSSSKSLKNYYNSILINLADILYEITDEIEEIRITKRNEIFMEKYAFNTELNIRQTVRADEYVKLIDVLTHNSLKKLKPVNKKYKFKCTISLDDAKDIIKNFICYYDITLYPIVNKALSDEHLFVINDKYRLGDGYSYFNTYSKSPYIVIYIDGKLNIDCLICLIHEIGHIIHFYTTQNKPTNYTKIVANNFIEVPSTTLENLFIDYLMKNNIEIINTQKVLNNNLNMLKSYLKYLRVNNRIIDKVLNYDEIETKKLQQLLASKGTSMSENTICKCFSNLPLNYSYSLGGLIAAYYLEEYRKDPEKTNKNIYDFSKCIGIAEDFYMLNNFGINLEKLKQCMYLGNIVDENQKQLQYKR